MRQLLLPFSRLQWKLTLTYTLVTTVAVLLAMFTPVVWAWRSNDQSERIPRLIALDVRRSADEIAPLLERNPQDLADVRLWVQQSAAPIDRIFITGERTAPAEGPAGVLAAPAAVVPSSPLPGTAPSADTTQFRFRYFASPTFIAVVDARGTVIASNGDVKVGESFPVQRYPQIAMVMNTALQGAVDPMQLTIQDTKNDVYYFGAPVLGEQSQVLGAVVRTAPVPFTRPAFLVEIFRIILPISLAVLLFAGVVGTVFGYFTSRWLTRRLDSLTVAANAWSQGDFATQATDDSADELGQLAARLNHMAGQLQRLVATREQLAALEERNRLARDVHDSVKQQVFAISMNLGAAQAVWNTQTDVARDRIDDAATLAQQTQQELTEIIQTLRSARLEEKGLAQALWELVRAWEKQTNIPVEDEIHVDRPLPSEVEEAVFRICQEALANIARHSGATAASVRVTTGPAQLKIQVTDNGRGFDLTQPSDGMGLRSIRERVQALGGQLEVKSHKGTRLTAVIPLGSEAV